MDLSKIPSESMPLFIMTIIVVVGALLGLFWFLIGGRRQAKASDRIHANVIIDRSFDEERKRAYIGKLIGRDDMEGDA